MALTLYRISEFTFWGTRSVGVFFVVFSLDEQMTGRREAEGREGERNE